MVQELEPVNSATQGDLDRLNLTVAPFLEKNIESLLECVDDLVTEQQKVTMYHKNVARQAQVGEGTQAGARIMNGVIMAENEPYLIPTSLA